MSNTADRIKQFAKEKFKTLVALEKAMGLQKGSLSSYISGRKSKPGSEIQDKLRAVGADVEWIMTGERNDWGGLDLEIKRIEPMEGDFEIPVMLAAASCGDPMPTSNEVDFYTRPAKLYNDTSFYVLARGNSMSGATGYVMEGDWMLVDTKKKAANGNLVLVRINDNALIKRLRTNGEDILLTPDNPLYNPIIVKDSSARILGVITKIERVLI